MRQDYKEVPLFPIRCWSFNAPDDLTRNTAFDLKELEYRNYTGIPTAATKSIKIFKDIKEGDYVLSNHRGHYHALLHGIPPETVKDRIVNMEMKRNKSGEIAKKERRKLDLRLAEFDERLSMLEIKINQIKEGVENANRRNKKY